jgi:hypothetical protein
MGTSDAAAPGQIVAFQGKNTNGAKAPSPGFVDSSDLRKRAEIAAKQMRYFGLVAQKSRRSANCFRPRNAPALRCCMRTPDERKRSFSGPQANPTFSFPCHSSVRTGSRSLQRRTATFSASS